MTEHNIQHCGDRIHSSKLVTYTYSPEDIHALQDYLREALGDRMNKQELCTAGFLVIRWQVSPGLYRRMQFVCLNTFADWQRTKTC